MSASEAPSSSPSSDPCGPLAIDVSMAPDSGSHFFVDLTGDVGHVGLFVATWRAVPVGREVMLVSELPDGPLVASGRVQWARDAECEVGPGIGVTLEGLSAHDLARIARFCEEWPPYYYEVEAA